MITTKELYEWREKVLKTKEQAEELADNYEQEEIGYYEHLAKVADSQLSIIERLIEQSRANEKEQICQK